MELYGVRAVCTAAIIALPSATSGAQLVKVGAHAPEIDLPTLSGGRVQLSKMKGYPVVISFWGTWCPPCRTEFPDLVRLHAEHSPAGLIIIGVNGRDQEKSDADVHRFVREFSVPFPIALDKRGRTRRAYRLEGEPTTIFIDAGGVVRAAHTGLITRDELDRGVALILPSK